jgi:hypothetical protein
VTLVPWSATDCSFLHRFHRIAQTCKLLGTQGVLQSARGPPPPKRRKTGRRRVFTWHAATLRAGNGGWVAAEGIRSGF